jgi:hypothetical protein
MRQEAELWNNFEFFYLVMDCGRRNKPHSLFTYAFCRTGNLKLEETCWAICYNYVHKSVRFFQVAHQSYSKSSFWCMYVIIMCRSGLLNLARTDLRNFQSLNKLFNNLRHPWVNMAPRKANVCVVWRIMSSGPDSFIKTKLLVLSVLWIYTRWVRAWYNTVIP